MSNPYRVMCAELADLLERSASVLSTYDFDRLASQGAAAAHRARTLLAQPVPEGPKPVVDYSRVTEIATEAQIRSAAQYLVKKRNCDGDLIPAIEYAIARWGHPTPEALDD